MSRPGGAKHVREVGLERAQYPVFRDRKRADLLIRIAGWREFHHACGIMPFPSYNGGLPSGEILVENQSHDASIPRCSPDLPHTAVRQGYGPSSLVDRG